MEIIACRQCFGEEIEEANRFLSCQPRPWYCRCGYAERVVQETKWQDLPDIH